MKTFILIYLFTVLGIGSLQAITLGEMRRPYIDRMYIDENEFSVKVEADSFYIHVGDNEWIGTHSVHRDEKGLFTYESQIIKCDASTSYEKKWRCPYCYRFSSMGMACENKECPSHFRG
jgi:hypothetical protein